MADRNNRLTCTYQMHPNPPALMPWAEYERRILAEWDVLLNSQQGCDETGIHAFLAQHPSMVPGAHSMAGPSGHSPLRMALLSESPLAGIGMKIPDFIWLASDSANFTPVFIEIESPRKRWFTAEGVPTHDLVQGVNQLAEWRAWLNRPENAAVFYAAFEIPEDMRQHLNFRPEFVLIYGRRQEFEERPQLRRLRDQFERHGQVAMTFDRLKPAQDCHFYLSATKRNAGYRAVAVPATFQLGPNIASNLARIANVPDAIQQNEWISEDRRRFLIERLAYWNQWAQLETAGVIRGGDWE